MIGAEATEFAGLLLVIGSLELLRPAAKGKVGEWFVALSLKGAGTTAMNDVILPDDRGLTQIDHLLLTPAGIVILETKNYGGKLYDRGRKRPWLQYIGKQKNSLHNPLDQNYRHRKAVECLVPGVPILDFVILAGSGRFGSLTPDGVLTIPEMQRKIGELKRIGEVPDYIRDAWNTLQRAARRDGATRRAHMRSVTGGTADMWRVTAGKWGFIAGAAILVAGIA